MALLRKMICNSGDPVSLRHPVLHDLMCCRTHTYIHTNTCVYVYIRTYIHTSRLVGVNVRVAAPW